MGSGQDLIRGKTLKAYAEYASSAHKPAFSLYHSKYFEGDFPRCNLKCWEKYFTSRRAHFGGDTLINVDITLPDSMTDCYNPVDGGHMAMPVSGQFGAGMQQLFLDVSGLGRGGYILRMRGGEGCEVGGKGVGGEGRFWALR